MTALAHNLSINSVSTLKIKLCETTLNEYYDRPTTYQSTLVDLSHLGCENITAQQGSQLINQPGVELEDYVT